MPNIKAFVRSASPDKLAHVRFRIYDGDTDLYYKSPVVLYPRLCDIASSHMARRTFIGNLYKKVKDPNIIASMSGHIEGSKAFARYRYIDDDIKQSVIDLI